MVICKLIVRLLVIVQNNKRFTVHGLKYTKKMLWTEPGGQRGRGLPKSRWIDGLNEDARKLGCRNWLADAQNRGGWRNLLEETKAHSRLPNRV